MCFIQLKPYSVLTKILERTCYTIRHGFSCRRRRATTDRRRESSLNTGEGRVLGALPLEPEAESEKLQNQKKKKKQPNPSENASAKWLKMF